MGDCHIAEALGTKHYVSLIFCQHTRTLTQVLLWCLCSIMIDTPQSQRYICSSSLAVLWTSSFVQAMWVTCSCCQILVCQTHPWHVLTHGVHEDSCNKVIFSKAEQRSRDDWEGIILNICLYQNVSSKLLQGPRNAEHSQQTEQLWNHRPVTQHLIGHFLYRKFCISLIYDGSHEEKILTGKMLSCSVCFKRISTGQTAFDHRKHRVSLRKVMLKFFHNKWWLLGL